MIVYAQDKQKLEITYTNGYYVVSKWSLSKPKSASEPLSQELSAKEYNHAIKTYAHVTGLLRQLREWDCFIEDIDDLVKDIKLEEGIKNAVRAKALKERGGIRK